MTYFDANTWIGQWPFAFLDSHTPRSLAAHLKRSHIERALVSPLDAVFAPEPGPANRALLRDTAGVAALVPVPVINPALANWEAEIANAGDDRRVKAIRLLPNYHGYALTHPAVIELFSEATKRELRVIVQVRLIDERHEYHAMNLKAVPVAELQVLLRKVKQPFLASGLLRSEIMPLASKFPQLMVDLSMAEWHDTLPHLLAKVPVQQLVFASHTPFLITAASTEKLIRSEVKPAALQQIAATNLERFLR